VRANHSLEITGQVAMMHAQLELPQSIGGNLAIEKAWMAIQTELLANPIVRLRCQG